MFEYKSSGDVGCMEQLPCGDATWCEVRMCDYAVCSRMVRSCIDSPEWHCTVKQVWSIQQVKHGDSSLQCTSASKTVSQAQSKSQNPSRLNAIMKRSRLASQPQGKEEQAFIIISHQGHEDGVEVVVRCRREAETSEEDRR